MSRTRTILVALTATLAFSAVTSASASAAAPGWMVSGKNLEGSAALATTAATVKTYALSGGGFSIVCAGPFHLDGPFFVPPNFIVWIHIWLNCISTTTNCKLSSADSSIQTVPILSESTLEGTSGVRVTSSPKTGTLIATVKFEGETCSGAGVKAVTGKVISQLPAGQTEGIAHEFSVNTTATEGTLKFASGAATLSGSALIKLASGEPWSYL